MPVRSSRFMRCGRACPPAGTRCQLLVVVIIIASSHTASHLRPWHGRHRRTRTVVQRGTKEESGTHARVFVSKCNQQERRHAGTRPDRDRPEALTPDGPPPLLLSRRTERLQTSRAHRVDACCQSSFSDAQLRRCRFARFAELAEGAPVASSSRSSPDASAQGVTSTVRRRRRDEPERASLGTVLLLLCQRMTRSALPSTIQRPLVHRVPKTSSHNQST